MKKPKTTKKPVARWRNWTDPREGSDFGKWTLQHRKYVLLRATSQINDLIRSVPEGAPMALIAARTGLSAGTVRKYLRKGDMGRRGPLLTTYLALRAMGKDNGNGEE